MTTSVAYSETVPESLTRLVLSHLREIPDFPEPGVLFRDITPLLADGGAFTELVDGPGVTRFYPRGALGGQARYRDDHRAQGR